MREPQVIRAGRLLPVEGAEHATYPTINVLPTRVRFDTEGYLQRVQADISAAVAFEHIPLSHVQKWLPPGTAPFDTLFAVTVKDDTHYEVWDILGSELPEPDVRAIPLKLRSTFDGFSSSPFRLRSYSTRGMMPFSFRLLITIVDL